MEAAPLSYEELVATKKNESSETIRSRVVACQQIQRRRYEGEAFIHNSRIPASKIKLYCGLGQQEEAFMEKIFEKEQLTGRSFHKILRVARTIADLEEQDNIQLRHLKEAVCYRSISERYWGGAE